MVYTKKNKQLNKKRFSQLTEGGTHFMIGQSNHEVQNGNIDSVARRGPSSDNTSNLTQINFPQVDMHTLAENVIRKVRNEEDNVMTTVETKVQDAVLTAIGILVIPRVELAMK